MASPPLYNSFDDVNQPKCVFCCRNNNDIVSLGDKYSYDEITFHNFCLVSGFCILHLHENHSLDEMKKSKYQDNIRTECHCLPSEDINISHSLFLIFAVVFIGFTTKVWLFTRNSWVFQGRC